MHCPPSTSNTRGAWGASTSSSCNDTSPHLNFRRRRHNVSVRLTSRPSHEDSFKIYKGEELPMERNFDSRGILHGVRTTFTPLLTPQKVFDRLFTCVHPAAIEHFGAFYSSELGGIVTHPAFHILHMDDHLVHRGHAIFDTALITDGFVYQLPQHVERFVKSAESAGIELPMSEQALMRIVLDTAAASKKSNGIIKFWLSSGRGGYGLSPSECIEPSLYVVATSENTVPMDRTQGWRACASQVPPKPAPFGQIKSNNYLQNVLALTNAQQDGKDVGIFVDKDGFVLEGPNSNFGILTQDNTFVTPPFDNILAGITVQRLMEIIPEEHKRWPKDIIVEKIEQRPIHSDEILHAKEAFLMSSSIMVMPIIEWNGVKIADGMSGQLAVAFSLMLERDRKPKEGSTQHIEVPYGAITGMRSQLF